MDFPCFFNNICSLLEVPDLKERSYKFSECCTDLERVMFVTKLEPVREQIDKLKLALESTVSANKCSELSTKFRNQGNQCFLKKQNLLALKFYNQSICTAPGDKGNELSLAFANRSAVLFDLGRLLYCLRDIGLALAYDYPDNLRYKLYERRGNCWVKLADHEQASASFSLAQESLNDADLDQDKRLKIFKNLESKRKDLTMRQSDKFEVKNVEAIEREIQSLREVPPFLNRPINPELPCASTSVKVARSDDKGRHLIATEHLEAGMY